MHLHLLLPLSHHLLRHLSPVTPFILLLRLPTFPAHSLLSPLPVRLGPLLPLCRPPLPLLHRILTFLLLWLQDPLLSTLLHHPQSEFGPPRLTRFLEMPLDRYVNVVTAMINDGRFSHIGHEVLRLEGQTAWGVWLRINHWDSSQGRRARLRDLSLGLHGLAFRLPPRAPVCRLPCQLQVLVARQRSAKPILLSLRARHAFDCVPVPFWHLGQPIETPNFFTIASVICFIGRNGENTRT